MLFQVPAAGVADVVGALGTAGVLTVRAGDFALAWCAGDARATVVAAGVEALAAGVELLAAGSERVVPTVSVVVVELPQPAMSVPPAAAAISHTVRCLITLSFYHSRDQWI